MAEYRDVTELRAWVIEHIAERPYGPREAILEQIDAAPRQYLGYRDGFADGCAYGRAIDQTIARMPVEERDESYREHVRTCRDPKHHHPALDPEVGDRRPSGVRTPP